MNRLSPRLAAILETLPITPGMRVLEVGCGTGALARAIAARIGPEGHVLGIDRSARAIESAIARSTSELASGRLSFRRIAVEDFALEVGEAPFDLIVAVWVGALDGRHPQAGARAWPRLQAALASGGKIFIDGREMAPRRHNPRELREGRHQVDAEQSAQRKHQARRRKG
jgi:cyclopropane fatty-acyl-phospholipid synthase-like methyltransferase